ncbi:uncharacterized protein TNCV_2494051 [Trichonephila clavipes]|uniref:Uncharacterized protein n=1 Tax=Trichonephila clavipes TaxID=2585209 RepID=A0A8X6VAP7_TRICX|nr:uncharacterized protein TNCV_2494051 [Trichonephila clavipes]
MEIQCENMPVDLEITFRGPTCMPSSEKNKHLIPNSITVILTVTVQMYQPEHVSISLQIRHREERTFAETRHFILPNLEIKRIFRESFRFTASRVARDKPWSTLCKKSHGIPSSPRAAAVAKFRLLTGHDCLCAHLFRFNLVTSPICVLCDTGQDMTAAHLDECSALNNLNCIVKRKGDRKQRYIRYAVEPGKKVWFEALLVSLNHDQVTMTMPVLALSSPNFHTTSVETF